MVEYYIDPEDVISDFLRVNLSDPRSRAETTNTNTFSATAGQTEFTISQSESTVQCITQVTVNSVIKKKWVDYFWDYQNYKITFFTALSLNDAVIVTFKYGSTNWIYSDKPKDSLSAISFPRIEIFSTGSPSEKIGNYDAPVHSEPSIQIDCWARTGYQATINGKIYSNEYLGRYLANQIKFALEDNEETLFGIFYEYNLNGPRAAPYSKEFVSYHSVIDVTFQGTGVGRIIK